MDGLTEVQPLREVPRDPTCCDRPMTKMQNASPSTGKMITVYVCGKCSAQLRAPEPNA